MRPKSVRGAHPEGAESCRGRRIRAHTARAHEGSRKRRKLRQHRPEPEEPPRQAEPIPMRPSPRRAAGDAAWKRNQRATQDVADADRRRHGEADEGRRRRWRPGRRPFVPSSAASTKPPRRSASFGRRSSRWRRSGAASRGWRTRSTASRSSRVADRKRRSRAAASTPSRPTPLVEYGTKQTRRNERQRAAGRRRDLPSGTGAATKGAGQGRRRHRRMEPAEPVAPPVRAFATDARTPVTLVPDDTPAPYA